jgi:cell wall-associated NlpC family hydrolase
MTTLDKRLHAFRGDLADETLRGQCDATEFVRGVDMQCAVPVSAVRRAAAIDAMQLTQVLWGEIVKVFERKDGWAWVQLQRDGYVGYVEDSALAEVTKPSSHRLLVRSSHVYPAPDLKTQPAVAIPMGAELAPSEVTGDYVKLTSGHFVYAQHLNASVPTDFVSVAEQFLHTPYLWGGKTVWGLDCSGLVQVSLHAIGKDCLRDSDMQEQSLSIAIGQDHLQRGDLVFWKGHVGIMQDAITLLHANGHHMMVVSEPLKTAVDRIATRGSHVTSVKRLQ